MENTISNLNQILNQNLPDLSKINTYDTNQIQIQNQDHIQNQNHIQCQIRIATHDGN